MRKKLGQMTRTRWNGMRKDIFPWPTKRRFTHSVQGGFGKLQSGSFYSGRN